MSAGTEDYGISESALAMLRTLESDHSQEKPATDNWPSGSRLVFHGCGTILMMGCPIGMDWKVEHLSGDRVRLSDVRRFDTTSDTDVVTFPGLAVDIEKHEYREVVTHFAQEARQLFNGVTKRIPEDQDRQQYERFWTEYDALLAKHASLP